MFSRNPPLQCRVGIRERTDVEMRAPVCEIGAFLHRVIHTVSWEQQSEEGDKT